MRVPHVAAAARAAWPLTPLASSVLAGAPGELASATDADLLGLLAHLEPGAGLDTSLQAADAMCASPTVSSVAARMVEHTRLAWQRELAPGPGDWPGQYAGELLRGLATLMEQDHTRPEQQLNALPGVMAALAADRSVQLRVIPSVHYISVLVTDTDDNGMHLCAIPRARVLTVTQLGTQPLAATLILDGLMAVGQVLVRGNTRELDAETLVGAVLDSIHGRAPDETRLLLSQATGETLTLTQALRWAPHGATITTDGRTATVAW